MRNRPCRAVTGPAWSVCYYGLRSPLSVLEFLQNRNGDMRTNNTDINNTDYSDTDLFPSTRIGQDGIGAEIDNMLVLIAFMIKFRKNLRIISKYVAKHLEFIDILR